MIASLNGHAEVVDKLLQHGATVDLQDEVITISSKYCSGVKSNHSNTLSLLISISVKWNEKTT